MPSYPTSIFAPSVKTAGQTIQPAHVNDLQDEVVAIEQGITQGTAPLNSSNSTVANLSVLGGSTFVGPITFSTGVTISTGTLTLNQGQIVFPATQVPSAGANTLDDYEEGTWTPTLGGNTTYAAQTGTYTKIGRQVTIHGRIAVTTLGTGSASLVSGLPFTAAANTFIGSVGYFDDLATNVTWLGFVVNSGTATAQFVGLTAVGNITTNPVTVFQNGTDIYFSCTYFV